MLNDTLIIFSIGSAFLFLVGYLLLALNKRVTPNETAFNIWGIAAVFSLQLDVSGFEVFLKVSAILLLGVLWYLGFRGKTAEFPAIESVWLFPAIIVAIVDLTNDGQLLWMETTVLLPLFGFCAVISRELSLPGVEPLKLWVLAVVSSALAILPLADKDILFTIEPAMNLATIFTVLVLVVIRGKRAIFGTRRVGPLKDTDDLDELEELPEEPKEVGATQDPLTYKTKTQKSPKPSFDHEVS